MSADFDSITEDTFAENDTFSLQDDDKRILFKWAAMIASVVVATCLATASLLKVLGIISVPWLWVVAVSAISSAATGLIILLAAVLLAAAFVNSIMNLG